MTVLEAIVASLSAAASYNKHELSPPRVILWPDGERLWTECAGALREARPAFWTLGGYDPGQASGPSAWLRCQLDGHSGDEIPVVYLPGVGRAEFRSADQCPAAARHLFALQFQGQFWTQKNGKDWTPSAYLSSADGGLGLDVANNAGTRKAIQESLSKLLSSDVASLRGHKLEASDFHALVTADPARTLLRWMGDPVKVRAELEKSGSEWASFRAVCRESYGFDPEKDGAVTAAERLSSKKPSWKLTWGRYKEAPLLYPGIKELLDTKSQPTLFEPPNEYHPNDNRVEEAKLEQELLALPSLSAKDAAAKLLSLCPGHEARASWVWASLGESPLAKASGPLREMAEAVQASGNPSTWEALAEHHATVGWKADWGALRALDAARPSAVSKAVSAAIRAVYFPWLEKFSHLVQGFSAPYPVSGLESCRTLPVEQGTIYLFADGLRMDLARSLEERLLSAGFEVALEHGWSALPTVTATAKSAWRPLADRLGGPLEGTEFQPKEKKDGKTLAHARFKQLMSELGIVFLESGDAGLPMGCAWTEFGAVDSIGHEQGARLAWRVEEELAGLWRRAVELLEAGWAKVRIVTDHGWLLLPGGLPKVELPKHLAESLWGRCAIPGAGAQHGYRLTSWFWDSAEAVVLAPGVSCFKAGMEYAHGGLTLQEALIPSLTVSVQGGVRPRSIALKEMKWSGLRLNMLWEGAGGLTVDLRIKAADPAGSFAAKPAAVGEDSKAKLLVEDDGALGSAAFLVVIGKDGQPVFKQSVVIGENK